MDINELKKTAAKIRVDVVKMLTEAKSGHPGGSLSVTDIMVGLYFSAMRHDPKNPKDEKRDRFVLSKGHVAPALYSCLAESGYFPVEELMTLRKLGSRLQGHPAVCKGLPGIEVSSGSLGQGLSVGVGMALGLKKKKSDSRVYVVMGDGELQEGSVWEAAMSAGHFKLDNICGIVDNNGLQIDGECEKVMGVDPLKDKWASFRWNVIEIDGHNMEEILKAFDAAKKTKDKPTVIIAHTEKGKGVSFMENVCGWHGKAPDRTQCDQAVKELEAEGLY